MGKTSFAVFVISTVLFLFPTIVFATHGLEEPTPGRYINRDTFPTGSRQRIDYAYSLRVRTGPSNNCDVLTFVHRGDEFEILDYNGKFVLIYTQRGVGWIFAGFLSREFANATEGLAEIYRPSPPTSITEVPDLNISLSAYHLRFFDGSMHDFTGEYESQYGIIRHESHGTVFAIRTDTTIPNFELLTVGFGGGDTGLMYFYPGEALYSFDIFTPENALVVSTHFGTMPRIAVAFVDTNGERRYFIIQQSGMDGSILLLEFQLDKRNPF